MRKIDRAEVNKLIQSQQAGWYAVWANPPQPHPVQTVVEIGDDYYLVSKEEFDVECSGPVMIRGMLKQSYMVHCYNPELTALLKADSERGKKIDLGAGLPTYHTDNLKPGDRKCPST